MNKIKATHIKYRLITLYVQGSFYYQKKAREYSALTHTSSLGKTKISRGGNFKK